MSKIGTGLGSGFRAGLSYASGYGYGTGTGYGSGYGNGYSCGSGYGSGTGSRSAAGSKSAAGFGHGANNGSGPNPNFGYGISFSYGQPITEIANHKVYLSPWGITVGCMFHTFATWKEKWETLALEHGINPDTIRSQVETLLQTHREDR